jgi:hypothetical protein
MLFSISEPQVTTVDPKCKINCAFYCVLFLRMFELINNWRSKEQGARGRGPLLLFSHPILTGLLHSRRD